MSFKNYQESLEKCRRPSLEPTPPPRPAQRLWLSKLEWGGDDSGCWPSLGGQSLAGEQAASDPTTGSQMFALKHLSCRSSARTDFHDQIGLEMLPFRKKNQKDHKVSECVYDSRFICN